MADIVESADYPNFDNMTKEDRAKGKLPIESTRGVWVRKNREEDTLEIWVEGDLFAAWAGADNVEGRVTTFLRYIFNHGMKVGMQENQRNLREALGLGSA